MPFLRVKVNDRRNALNSSAPSNGKAVLIVGNHKCSCPDDISRYGSVIVFNSMNNEWAREFATERWMRIKNESGIDGSAIAGEEIDTPNTCNNIVLMDIKGRNSFVKEMGIKGKMVARCFSESFKSNGYTFKRVPSTGYCAIVKMIREGYEVNIDGFSFSGIDCHDWTYEAREALRLESIGAMKMSDESRMHAKNVSGIYEMDSICKKGHFIWLDYSRDGAKRELNATEYFAIRTFIKHNPDFNVFLHTNCIMTGSLFERISNKHGLILKTISLNNIPSGIGSRFGIHKSDYMRMRILYCEGGIFNDLCDTITMGSMSSLLEKSTRLSLGKDSNNKCFHTGLIMTRHQGDPIIRNALSWCNTSYFKNSDQRAALEHYLKELFDKNRCLFNDRWESSVAYPIPGGERYLGILESTNSCADLIKENTVQAHWYSGSNSNDVEHSRKVMSFLRKTEMGNWRTASNIYAECLRISFGKDFKDEDV